MLKILEARQLQIFGYIEPQEIWKHEQIHLINTLAPGRS